MGSTKKPDSDNLKFNWPFMLVFSVIIIIVLIFVPSPLNQYIALAGGLVVRQLGNAWPAFYDNCKIALNNWLTK